MIDQAAIDEFLKRPLTSYDWTKALTHSDLDLELAAFQPPPNFNNLKLWQHQKALFILLSELHRFMLHVSMGGGKTLTSLLLLKYRKQRGENPKALVLVPYITAVDTWVEEVRKYAPELVCVPLLGGSSDRYRDCLTRDADLIVGCYQSVLAMVAGKAWDDKKEKVNWTIDGQAVRDHFPGVDTLILDEIHKCQRASSSTYRMCRALSAQCEYVIGLTGTPFGKDLSALWPQFYLIDFGETLGSTLGFYREVFFERKDGYFKKFDYKFKKKLLPDLHRIIKNCSIHYGLDEFYDMPPKKYITKTLDCEEVQQGYINIIKGNIKDSIRNSGQFALREIESHYMRLRQLSSGFLTLHGEDSAKVHIAFDESPKLEALTELLEGIPTDSKVVVFHHFVYSNEMLAAHLKKLGIKCARIWGGQKNPLGELKKFREKADCQVLLLNSKSGSSSLNLQQANYVIFYEQPDSPIDRQQAEYRVWRPGQSKRVLIYDLLMNGTADWPLYSANKAGANLLKQLLKGEVNL